VSLVPLVVLAPTTLFKPPPLPLQGRRQGTINVQLFRVTDKLSLLVGRY